MRRLVALVFVTCTLSCSTPQNITEQAQLPALTPPPMHAPICARPAERAAIDVSALVSELQLITMTCGTRDKYKCPHSAFAPGPCNERKETQRLLHSRLWQKGPNGARQIHY